MFALSRKDIANRPTPIRNINVQEIFLSDSNQRNIAKQLFNLHKAINGKKTYFYFKEIASKRMVAWAYKKNIKDTKQLVYDVNLLDFINKTFIRENEDLYKIAIPGDSNVYETAVPVSYPDLYEEEARIFEKKPNELLAEDIRNIDVWRKQTTEVNSNVFRYRNTIPVWQKSMNIRHYDIANQGLHHSDSNRASLEGLNRGYGKDFYNLQQTTKARLNSLNIYD